MRCEELSSASQEVADQDQLGFGVARETAESFLSDGAPDLVRSGVRLARELDENTPAVVGIANAANISGALEAVEERRDRACRKPARLRQLPGGDPAVLIDDVQAAAVASVDSEPRAGHVVEEILGVLVHPRLEADLGEERGVFFL